MPELFKTNLQQIILPKPRNAVYTEPMKADIKRYRPENEYFFVEGCHINELSNHADDPNVSIARARVLPGISTHWHTLTAITERYVILEGQGEVEVGHTPPHSVFPGDVVVIPADTQQRITNTGQNDLVFLAICTPRFLSENYLQHSDERIGVRDASK